MTISSKTYNYKTQICRKVNVGGETITLKKFGIQDATFKPIVYHVMRNHRGIWERKEGEFETKKAAVAFFNELVNFYKA